MIQSSDLSVIYFHFKSITICAEQSPIASPIVLDFTFATKVIESQEEG